MRKLLGRVWRWFWAPVPVALNMLFLGMLFLWHIELTSFTRPGELTNLVTLPAITVYHLSLWGLMGALLVACHKLAQKGPGAP